MTTTPHPSTTLPDQRAEAARLRRVAFARIHGLERLDQASIPDVPIDRYDVCTCGHARFMHGGRDQVIRVASSFGKACAGFTYAYEPLG